MLGLFTFIIKPCKHVPLMFGFVVGFVVVVVVVLLGGLRPVLGFPIHLDTHRYRLKATNLDLHSALMAIEQWGEFP